MTDRYRTDAELRAERELRAALLDLYEHQQRTLLKLKRAKAAAERLRQLQAVDNPSEPSTTESDS